MRALWVAMDSERWNRFGTEIQAAVCNEWPDGYDVVIVSGDVVAASDCTLLQKHLDEGRHVVVLPPIPTPLAFSQVAGTTARLEVVGHQQGTAVDLAHSLNSSWTMAGGIGSPSVTYHQRIATPLPLEVLATDEHGNIILFCYRANNNSGCLVISCLWLGSSAPGTNGSDRRMLLRSLLDWVEQQHTPAGQPQTSPHIALPERLESLAHLLAVVLAYHSGSLAHTDAISTLELIAQIPVGADGFDVVCRHFVAQGVLHSTGQTLQASPAALDAYLRERGLHRAVQLLRERAGRDHG